jgi:hypothetical protein
MSFQINLSTAGGPKSSKNSVGAKNSAGNKKALYNGTADGSPILGSTTSTTARNVGAVERGGKPFLGKS